MIKKKFAKALAVALTVVTTIGTIFTPISAEVTNTQEITQEQVADTDVIINGGASRFSVIIPKAMSGTGKSGNLEYLVTVEGDIAGMEIVKVIPDKTIVLKQLGKTDVIANITQEKQYFRGSELVDGAILTSTGAVNFEGITAGVWNGIFNFNISLSDNVVPVTVVDSQGNNLNATSTLIEGDEADVLLNALVESGNVKSKDDVNLLINIETDDFNNITTATFDVSSIADEGEKVAILHFNEESNEWELVGIETVLSNKTVSGMFTSYSPVAFVIVTDDGLLELINYYTITWNAPLATIGGFFSDIQSFKSKYESYHAYSGGHASQKSITYTDKNGNVKVVSPFVTNSIQIKKGTKLIFDFMGVNTGSSKSGFWVYENGSQIIFKNGGPAWLYGDYTPKSNCTISMRENSKNSYGAEYWKINIIH